MSRTPDTSRAPRTTRAPRIPAEPLPARLDPAILEAGCDEAGRGCLAGPVVAAAVILPPDFSHPLVIDSKKLSEARRSRARMVVMEHALAWAVGIVSEKEIDSINILNASILAMHSALDALTLTPQAIIVDGNRFKPWRSVPHTTVVKGDAKYGSIAAASIIAKTTRDALMEELHAEWPLYGWDVNKGYPTAAHREAIRLHGPTPYHRLTFRLT